MIARGTAMFQTKSQIETRHTRRMARKCSAPPAVFCFCRRRAKERSEHRSKVTSAPALEARAGFTTQQSVASC